MIEGKTKIITPLWQGASIGVVKTKDDITAGDGAKHDIIAGKAELATRTTCNVFELLRRQAVPLAYVGRDGPTTFLTRLCTMVPVEVVVRRVATGSYLKRHTLVADGTRFKFPAVEYFYKTTGRRMGKETLPCDDPLMQWNPNARTYDLYLPNKPMAEGLIGPLDLPNTATLRLRLRLRLQVFYDIATHVDRVLNDAWSSWGGTLYDFKLEFGVLPDDSIVLADVIDCDSWRVMWSGIQLSKQGYRDGDDLDRVLSVYRLAASLTDRFV